MRLVARRFVFHRLILGHDSPQPAQIFVRHSGNHNTIANTRLNLTGMSTNFFDFNHMGQVAKTIAILLTSANISSVQLQISTLEERETT